MVEGRKKSRTFRRVKVKTPGGNTKVQYKRRKPSKAKCAGCGAVLAGVARALPRKMQNMPKTKKRPTRAYAGVLCTKCTRKKITQKARQYISSS
ncbi:50S ribosomal protein L34e [Candidatus Woesearchaeota archaeon]|nr:50S ribosomal protein L34e [Candidatus Woesearchaeota archaeon]MBW3006008.1 50S ribosomal protein L34e [Candidatus Woesearchaeota archaeon]